jgi:excisionase family DNA binding protein
MKNNGKGVNHSNGIAPRRHLLDTADVMALLRVSRPTVYKLIVEQGLPAIKLGRHTVRYHSDLVERWLLDRADQGEHDAAGWVYDSEKRPRRLRRTGQLKISRVERPLRVRRQPDKMVAVAMILSLDIHNWRVSRFRFLSSLPTEAAPALVAPAAQNN